MNQPARSLRRKESSRRWWLDSVRTQVAVLAAAVAVTYAGAVAGGFVWLDHEEIEQGGYRISERGDWGRLATMTLDQYLARREGPSPSRGGYWRPLYALSISLDWLVWERRAWCYHVENVLWHLAVAIGLLLTGRRLVADGRAAFWATLLFAVHPLGIQSVTWISGRKDTMCAALGIAALLAFARGLDRDTFRSALPWHVLAAVLTLGAVLCKELGLVVPAAAALLLWAGWPEISQGRGHPGQGRPLVGFALLWIGPALVAVYRHTVLGGFGLNARYPADSLWTNFATAATLMWEYAGRVLCPRPPLLSDAWPIAQSIGPAELAAMGGLVLAAGVTAWGLRRRKPAAVAVAWTVIWLLPAAGILPLRHVRAERYLYPASWGLLLAGVIVWQWLLRKVEGTIWQRPAKFVLPAVCLVAAAVTVAANTKWRDDGTLFRDAVARDPHHVEGWVALANEALQRKDYPAAIAYGRNALEHAGHAYHTGYWSPLITHTNLGLAYYYDGKPEPALGEFLQALDYHPQNSVACYHVGMAAFALGQYERARDYYLRSLRLRPGDFLAASNLAVTHLRLGELRECVDLLEPLVREQPEDLTNRMNLASALLALGRYREALPHFAHLAEKEPENPLVLGKLAWCQWETGQRKEAERNLQRAAQIAPGEPIVRFLQQLRRREETK